MFSGISVQRDKIRRRRKYLEQARKLGVEEEVRSFLDAMQFTRAQEVLERVKLERARQLGVEKEVRRLLDEGEYTDASEVMGHAEKARRR